MIRHSVPLGSCSFSHKPPQQGLKSCRPSAGGAYLRFYSPLEPFFTKEWRALVK
jgi:hypothetical protein